MSKHIHVTDHHDNDDEDSDSDDEDYVPNDKNSEDTEQLAYVDDQDSNGYSKKSKRYKRSNIKIVS